MPLGIGQCLCAWRDEMAVCGVVERCVCVCDYEARHVDARATRASTRHSAQSAIVTSRNNALCAIPIAATTTRRRRLLAGARLRLDG